MSEPLTVLMASGPMPPEEVVRIGRELCSGLTSVHGELWPSSIAVSEGGVSVLPPASTDLSRYGMYAAPERILGKPTTPASDVFSVGAILDIRPSPGLKPVLVIRSGSKMFFCAN